MEKIQAMSSGQKKASIRGSDSHYKRWVFERTFAWLVQNRHLVRDDERSIQSASSWVFLAVIRIMINRYSFIHFSDSL